MTALNHPNRRSAHPLKVYRTAKLLSQAETARAAGVARSTIIRIEAGDRPSLKTALAIAAAIGVESRVLFPEERHA